MKISARVLFLVGFFIFVILFLPKQTFAQTTPDQTYTLSPTPNSLNTNPDVEKNLHNGAQIVFIETMSALACQLAGYDPITPDHKCLGVDPNTGKIGFVENGGGMIAVMGSMIDATFTPPASSTQYIAYLQNNFGITKKAHAAENPCINLSRGIGFCGLIPVQGLWIAMRNIVYLILILVFLVIGLGIMLRLHIDPRTVMTIQNQIPKIIIGIVLVTFSFAIAGLLIDIMFVATYLFASVITGSVVGVDALLGINFNFDKVISAPNPFSAANEAFDGGVLSVAGQTSSGFAEVIKSIFTGPSLTFSNIDFVGNIIGGIVGIIVNILAFLIIAIAIIVALVRLWVTLIITYVNILLDIIFAPFWLLVGLLPGSPGVGAWFRDLLANLAVFPVAISFFLLADIFVSSYGKLGASNFIPPLIGGVDPEAVGALIGLGFILMLPNVLTVVKAALKAPKINFGPIMSPIKAGAGIVGGAPKRLISGGLSEATRVRYNAEGNLEEPKGVRRAIRIFRGGH